MSRRRTALLLAVVLGGSALPATAAVRAPAPAALAGHRPAWAPAAARLGDAPDDAVAEVQVVLHWRDAAEAARVAYAVSDPAGPAYGRHLSAAAFRARFAPAETTVAAVTAWLAGHGLEVGEVPANRLVVPARGRVADVERAFRVPLGRYAAHGLVLRAPDATPSVPAALAPFVAGVRGLDEGDRLLRPGAFDDDPPPPLPVEEPATPADTAPPNAVVYAKPCSAHHGQHVDKRVPRFEGRHHPAVACGTTPQQLRAVYGAAPYVAKGQDGRGETIVITGSHAIRPLVPDVTTWSRRWGLPAPKPGQIRQLSYPGAYQTPVAEPYLRHTVWAVQASTLVETIHAVAPGANVLYLGSTSSLDLATATLLAVDGEMGDVVMNGWYSLSENVNDGQRAMVSRIAEQAAATGISLLFASGDLGDGTRSGNASPSPVYPANDPNVTAVGATSLLLGPKGRYLKELGWAKSQAYLEDGVWEYDLDATFRGSGGGVSAKFPQPAYQKGVAPGDLATGRAVPDLAVMGDAETAMVIGYTQRFPDGKDRYSERRLASGTASTALVAALLAVANSARGGDNLGFVNPKLYDVWRKNRAAYRDVVPDGRQGAGIRVDYLAGGSGETRTLSKKFEDFTSNTPRKGYDTNAGLGSPSPAFLGALVR